MEIPKIAPSAQPQLIRFAIARPPRTMTKMIATGVSQAKMFAWSDVAPERKGEACASARSGEQIMAARRKAEVMRASDPSCDISDLRLERVHFALAAAFRKLLTLRPARSAEAEVLNYIGVVVVLFAFPIDPVIRANLRLNDELIALA